MSPPLPKFKAHRIYHDGPLISHSDELEVVSGDEIRIESIDTGRQAHREALARQRARLSRDGEIGQILDVIICRPQVDMKQVVGRLSDDRIRMLIEWWYINAQIYLRPGISMPLGMVDRCRRDWELNARGIYYRHFFSRRCMEPDQDVWIPSVEELDWDDPTEAERRKRAKVFLKHTLDNEKWDKSEYAWEADAWTDVFGQMRDDPVLVGDKHEYYNYEPEHHPVSCLLNGKTKWNKRIPDATFGLRTFKPEEDQSAFAHSNLDYERLQALMLGPRHSLVSDPRLGDTNLVFPFLVYEAKGWSGDPREARYQACSAGAAYLDILDALARYPSHLELPSSGGIIHPYQTDTRANTQVFAVTSFGAHWHILVGCRRPRLENEYAGTPGLSDTVYVFQRVWSDRVVTEKKAWDLLSLIDQIHRWGVTDFRNAVISRLKAWHEFCREDYVNLAELLNSLPRIMSPPGGKHLWQIPTPDLPSWADNLSPSRRGKLQMKVSAHIVETYIAHCGPHRPEDIEALVSLIERLRQDDEVELWETMPLEPLEHKSS